MDWHVFPPFGFNFHSFQHFCHGFFFHHTCLGSVAHQLWKSRCGRILATRTALSIVQEIRILVATVTRHNKGTSLVGEKLISDRPSQQRQSEISVSSIKSHPTRIFKNYRTSFSIQIKDKVVFPWLVDTLCINKDYCYYYFNNVEFFGTVSNELLPNK